MYDWANSAFATTILAAMLPIYFSQVAGANLPSATVATSYWSFGLSLSLLFIAILSPILGTISDIQRGKKRFLAIFAGIGILATAMLVLVSTGDWVLASIFGILGRIGFSGANTLYDALLPILSLLEEVLDGRDALPAPSLANRLSGWYEATLRRWKKKWEGRRPGAQAAIEFHRHRYPGHSLADVQERLARLQRTLGDSTPLRVEQLSEEIFRIQRPADS